MEDGEGISKRSQRDNVAKASYKSGVSIHEGNAWVPLAASSGVPALSALVERTLCPRILSPTASAAVNPADTNKLFRELEISCAVEQALINVL